MKLTSGGSSLVDHLRLVDHWRSTLMPSHVSGCIQGARGALFIALLLSDLDPHRGAAGGRTAIPALLYHFALVPLPISLYRRHRLLLLRDWTMLGLILLLWGAGCAFLLLVFVGVFPLHRSVISAFVR